MSPKPFARPPVVMIHGAFCGGWAFEPWQTLFEAQGYSTYAPTLRYHDRGTHPPAELGTTSMLDYAADLERALDAIGSAPVLVGHSLGGLLAQMLAARRPLRALVLLAPSAPWGMTPSTPFEFLSSQALYLADGFWKTAIKPRHWIAAANALDLLARDERDAVFARFVPESGLATFETMQWMFDRKRATRVEARAVTCPILCLAGRRDRVNPPATVRRLARRYGGRARYEELSNHSHWLIGEPGWQKIAGGILMWLERVLADEGADAQSGGERR
ncbi:MAG TPA: alpha/beta hydrolase [Rhizomicrobium sp.]